MRTAIIIFSLLYMSSVLLYSCHHHSPKKHVKFEPSYAPGPQTIVYKTKKDYSKFVTVVLSEDKKTIVSYPDPTDVRNANGSLRLPTRLIQGYLLDNRGITKDVAFVKLTYSEYSKLSKPPSISELMKLILDNDPITEMYNCGLRSKFRNAKSELNSIIASGQISKCKKIK